MSEPFLGQITIYPYSFPPYQWQDCAGQILPIQQYAALFSLLGTNFGGNGTTNFGLPDLQGRVPVNQGQLSGGGDYVIGEESGQETVSILQSTMPSHRHSLIATTDSGTVNTPAGNLLAAVSGGSFGNINQGDVYNPVAPNTTLQTNSVAQNPGPGTPHNNIQPFLVLRYCISLGGVFPTRG